MAISMEDLKPLGMKMIELLNKDKEPLDEMKKVHEFLDMALSGTVSFQDQSTESYFYDAFLGGISKAALNSYHFKNNEMIELVKELCEKLIKLFPTMILKNHEDFTTRMRFVLDPDMIFYREYSAQLVEENCLQAFVEVDPKWEISLKQGDRVDVVKKEERPKLILGWTTGTVIRNSESELLICYDGESKPEKVNPKHIAPLSSYTGDISWRTNIQKGDVVDALDTAGVWYESTILDLKKFSGECDLTQVLVAFRIYIPTGSKKDASGAQYKGWSNNYDEWMSLYSLRIAKHGTLSRIGEIKCRKSYDEDDKPIIDDQSDILLNSLDKTEMYGILRPMKSKSALLVKLMNIFGNNGGFDLILSKLKEKTLSFELAYFYFDIIGVLWSCFHRKFAQKYFPDIQNAMQEYLLNAPDVEIRKIQAERFSKILKNFENLLRRVYTVAERYKIIEYFDLHMNIILFKSNYLHRRIQGLKGINDIIQNIKTGVNRFLKEKAMLKYIIKENFLEELFGERKHAQILQRSSPIVIFLYEHRKLSGESLEKIWDYHKDDQQRPDFFKLIAEFSFPLTSDEFKFFAEKISSAKPSELCEEALDVIYEASTYPTKPSDLLNYYSNILLKIAYSPESSRSLSEKALEKYTKMIMPLDLVPYKKDILRTCVESLKSNINVLESLKLIELILSYSPTQENPAVKVGVPRSEIIEILLNEFSLMEVFCGNFQKYHENGKGSERYTHTENIMKRIDFLNTLSLERPGKYFPFLWKLLYEEAKEPQDKNILFRYLKQFVKSQEVYNKYLDHEEILRFFEEKMGCKTNQFSNITLEEFECFQQFFLVINEKEGNILISLVEQIVPGSNYSHSKFYSCSFNYSEKRKVQEVSLKNSPLKIKGIEEIWRIMQESNDQQVMDASRDLLSKIYTQMAPEMQERESEMCSLFMETYLSKLEAGLKNSRTNEIKKLIKLMIDMIEKSEEKGTGGLKSHCSILKGERVSLQFENYISAGKTIPKKLEVETQTNITIWELKQEIGKYFESSAECLELIIENRAIRDGENGKTIGEFLLKNRGVIKVNKKDMRNIPKAPLLTVEGLTEPAKRAFAYIFGKFSNENKMDAEGCAQFIQNTTGEQEVLAQDHRVTMMINTYDYDKDGYLELAGFQDFYKDCLINGKIDTVWDNICTHEFRFDLKHLNEVEETKIDITKLPRYLLVKTPHSFELLFNILDIGGISAELVWDLVSRLSTNEEIYNQILYFEKFEDSNKKVNWSSIINISSKYRLMYCLQIIEALMEEEFQTEAEYESRKFWREQFILRGGFEYILEIFLNKHETKITFSATTHSLDKECLELLGKIINKFLQASIFSLKEDLYDQVMRTRKLVVLSGNEETIETSPTKLIASPSKKEKTRKEPELDLNELFLRKPSRFFTLVGTSREKKMFSKSSKITNSTAEYLMKLLNLKDMLFRQIHIMTVILQKEKIEHPDIKLLKTSINLFCNSILSETTLFEEVLKLNNDEKNSTFSHIINLGIFCNQSGAVREEFMDMLYFLAYIFKNEVLRNIFFTVLNLIPKQYSEECKTCGEFFELLCKLIEISYSIPSIEKGLFDSKKLVFDLIVKLKQHKAVEKRNSSIEDKYIIGLMNTIRTIITHEPSMNELLGIGQGLLSELFFNCLFPSISASIQDMPVMVKLGSQEEDVDAQKCKSKASRTSAYKLVAALCKDSLKCQSNLVQECLEPLCKSIKPRKTWGYIPSSESRSSLGYAGIENLGCICYMLAMIQQFFMIPSFRYALLNTDDIKPYSSKPGEIDDNVLHQLQRIFAFLEITERQAYNPSKFCHAFKDFNGKPTNTAVQQDAHEFLNTIFERLDTLLKVTPEKYLLQSVFGGKACNIIICKGGCGTVRKSYEDFYNVSVNVKGFKTLYESLNQYVAPDTISDWYCEICQKKVEAQRRTCIHELPNVLIVLLQRIVFNFDYMMNEKINTRLEFPEQLSVEPYTLEGLEARDCFADSKSKNETEITKDPFHGKEEKYYQYQLVGVVVHNGTAEAGHYYSYINTSRGKEESTKKGTWLEFNDSLIRPFDFNKLESECFGGSSESSNNAGLMTKSEYNNTKNAYMLVYERSLKKPIKKVVSSEEYQIRKIEPNIEILNEKEPNKEFIELIPYDGVSRRIPTNLYQEVWEDNINFLFERQIYSVEFFHFVEEILKESYLLLPSLPEESRLLTESSMVRIASRIIVEVLSHAYDNRAVKPMAEQLVLMLSQSATAALELLKYFMEEDCTKIMFILLRCPDKVVRNAISQLVFGVLHKLLKDSSHDVLSSHKDEHNHVVYNSEIGQFLEIYCLAPSLNLAEHWPRFEQYFEIIINLLDYFEEKIAIFMNEHHMISVLIDFYLENKSPIKGKRAKKREMGNRFRKPKFQNLIDIVSKLALRADLSSINPKIKDKKILKEPLYPIGENDKLCLESEEFFHKTIKDGYITQSFAQVFSVFCFDNEVYSKKIAKILLKKINEDIGQNIVNLLIFIEEILLISDSLQQQRIEWLLGFPAVKLIVSRVLSADKKENEEQFGLNLLSTFKEDVYEYPSPLSGSMHYESILSLMWKYRNKLDLNPIKFLLSLIMRSDLIFSYIANLPAPNYQYAFYSDWLRPIIEIFPDSYNNVMNYWKSRQTAQYESAINLLRCFENKREEKKFNPTYEIRLIGKPISEPKILFQEKNLIIYEQETEIYPSLPNGNDNSGIPSFSTKATEKEIKPSHSNSIMKIVVNNTSAVPVKISLKFSGKADNFYIPQSILTYYIEGNNNSTVLLLDKMNLSKPWGEFAIETSVKSIKNKKGNSQDNIDENYMNMYYNPAVDSGNHFQVTSDFYTSVICASCLQENNLTDTKCKKCGKALDSLSQSE